MHFDNSVCHVKHINADLLERTVIEKLSALSQDQAFLKISVEALNGDLQRKTEPLEKAAGQIKRRLQEIESEIGHFVKALGQGRLSIKRLENEIGGLEASKVVLEHELDDVQRKINESAARDYDADVLYRTLRDFKTAFAVLTGAERTEALQCVLKTVTVHLERLELEIFEGFQVGSQNRKRWLPRLDSN
jgi:chromosome segregation ATPase